MRGCARRSASGRLNSSGSGISRGWPRPAYLAPETARRGGGRCWGDEEVANRIPGALIQSADEELHPACHSGARGIGGGRRSRSEEHTSELQSQSNLVCRLLLEKKK